MSHLRRLAAQSPASNSAPDTPPITPQRPRLSHAFSPASTPSISSSIPFDWDAVRARRPPPYQSPASKLRTNSGRKSVIRKKSFLQKVKDIPSWVAFQVAVFPNNVPLPSPKTLACIAGGNLHFLHLCVRVSQAGHVPDSDLAWEDMYREDRGVSWFDWTVPVTLLLIGASCMNVLFLLTRTKIYRLNNRIELATTPNARFVPADFDSGTLQPPPLSSRLAASAWSLFIQFWRFLLGLKPSTPSGPAKKMATVQELEVWVPGDLELTLFSIYSPAHSILWMATTSNNWMLMSTLMGAVGMQLHVLISMYKTLVKDKEIIAAEVMAEYNEGFVYPRINPIRKDVAVMTHQSEVVNVWED